MSNVIGPDVSFYQDDNSTPRGINFAKMVEETPYVIIRAGQNDWPDPDFKTNWAASRAAFLARGSYWFYDSRALPVIQADLWFQQLGDDLGELPLFADFEESYGGAYAGWEKWIDFLEALKARAGRKEICIYTAYYYWVKHAPRPGVPLPARWQSVYPGMDALTYFKQYRLWIANYGAAKPLVPPPWGPEEWLFWQYTENGPGASYGVESRTIDLNYFHGDSVALRAEFGLSEPPPVPQPEEQHFVAYPGMAIHRVYRGFSWCHIGIVDPRLFDIAPTLPGLKTCSRVAELTGAQLVINGTDYYPSGRPNGLYYHDGDAIATQVDYQPYWHGAQDGTQTIRAFNARGIKFHAMAGKRFLVENGIPAVHTSAAWYEVHPRTLIGVNIKGETVVAVVDGRQPKYSIGMDLFDAAALLVEFGCIWATDFDGGGSSTFVLNGEVFNRPIDMGIPGKERAVGNAWTSTRRSSEPVPPPPAAAARKIERAIVEYQYGELVNLEAAMV